MASDDSVEKNNPLLIQGKCFNDCEVALTVGEEETQLYVCMDYLAQLSDYFRAMFFGDFKEKKEKNFQMTDEKSEDMICFFNAINPHPKIHKITDDSIELLMHLADKYQCNLLKERLKNHIEINEPKCQNVSTILDWLSWSLQYNMPEETVAVCLNLKKIDDSIESLMRLADKFQCEVLKEQLNEYIEENVPKCESGSIVLNWLILSVQYHMPQETIKVCLPCVACLSLSSLCQNREKIGLELFGKLMEMKDKMVCSYMTAGASDRTVTAKTKRVFLGQCCSCNKPECLCDRNQYQSWFNQ